MYTPASAVDLFRLALADNRIAFRSDLVTMVAVIGLVVNPLLTIKPIMRQRPFKLGFTASAVDLFMLALADNRIAFRSDLVTMVAMIGLVVNPLLTIKPILRQRPFV